jgi:Fur family ferric uptake transcriptional regulator
LDRQLPKSAWNKFVDFLEKKELKLTLERRAILESIFSIDSHFQAEDLLIQMRQKGLRVSKATIYRTLPLLLESGLLRELHMGDKQLYYEYQHDRQDHDHLICTNCGKIIEFSEPKGREIIRQVCRKNDFTISKYIIEIQGYCKDCQFAIPEN